MCVCVCLNLIMASENNVDVQLCALGLMRFEQFDPCHKLPKLAGMHELLFNCAVWANNYFWTDGGEPKTIDALVLNPILLRGSRANRCATMLIKPCRTDVGH